MNETNKEWEILQEESHLDDIGIVFMKNEKGEIYCCVDYGGGEIKFKLNFIDGLLSQKDTEWKERIRKEITEGVGCGRFGFSNEKGDVCIKVNDVLELLKN